MIFMKWILLSRLKWWFILWIELVKVWWILVFTRKYWIVIVCWKLLVLRFWNFISFSVSRRLLMARECARMSREIWSNSSKRFTPIQTTHSKFLWNRINGWSLEFPDKLVPGLIAFYPDMKHDDGNVFSGNVSNI